MRSIFPLIATAMLVVPATRASDLILPGTSPLSLQEPLDEWMVDRLRQFCRRELAASRELRAARWKRDYASAAAYAASIEGYRERLRAAIGAVDHRPTADPASAARYELIASLDAPSVVARSSRVAVHAVRWPVIEGVSAEGLLLLPDTPRAGVVALPDADWSPEMFCGIADGLPERVQLARRLAAAGCLVVVPALVSRNDALSGSPRVGYTNQPHREFLYRQAFEVGRHIIGYEVQKVLAAADLIEQLARQRLAVPPDRAVPIGVAGVGEGALLALHAAAIDPRLQASLVCGYFQEREGVWEEPIYRNVWGLLAEFGDAELAGLVAPRRLVIEACRAVEVAGPPPAREGRRASAAPGRIVPIRLAAVQAEFDRAAAIYRALGVEHALVLAVSGARGDGPAGSDASLEAFAADLGITGGFAASPEPWAPTPSRPVGPRPDLQDAAAREKRQFNELQVHIQSVLRTSHHEREAKWGPIPAAADAWEPARRVLRDWVHDELIGRLPQPHSPPNPRSRRVLDTAKYVGYEIVLDVYEEIIAGGILLLPKDLAPGEKRPLVVCQHGLEGTARDTLSRDPGHFRAYKAFAEELVHQGFVVYAPQNPYRGHDRFRVIQRMSNPLRRSLFSYIVAQHDQTLAWLATLPYVDAPRMAFYGLSYGGKTAMRVPPLVDRYCLSICSGDFTDWVRTIATNEERCGYVFTGEYEVPEWNMAHVASYAELAMLMAPRPFMVEAGHRDSGQPTEWVASEFGKVRRHYDQLGIADRAELEFFDGPHTIHGQGTYRFLQRHLQWPHSR